VRAGTFVDVGRMDCLDQPEVPAGDGDLVVRTELASICGSDLHIVMEGVGGFAPSASHPGYPGHEGVGRVIESHHRDFAVGDMVLCAPDVPISQSFAEIQTIPGRHCLRLPDGDVPRSQLLMAQQLGTVIFAHRRLPVDVAGKSVVVLGAGSAGQFHCFLSKRNGAAKVIAVDPLAYRLDVARAMGADVVVDSSTDDVRRRVAEETDGRGADHVIEAVGSESALLSSVGLAALGGSLLWFGLPDRNEPVRIDYAAFFRKMLRAGSVYGAQSEPDQASFREALDLIASGGIDVAPIISHTLPIERIQEAMDLAYQRPDGVLKVSVSFDG
jgi:L-iditol 2-dehydrogenase